MVDKYDLNRDSVIDRSEVLEALKDFFEGRITKADMQQVVKIYFTTIAADTEPTDWRHCGADWRRRRDGVGSIDRRRHPVYCRTLIT